MKVPAQYLPGVHAIHSDSEVPFVFALKVPGLQLTDSNDPKSQNPPLTQTFPVVPSVGFGVVALRIQ